MPTSSSSTKPVSSVTALATDLKAKLAASSNATLYVPLEGADMPNDEEIKSLAAEGLHVEYDAVRDALAARKATEDEIAEAKAPPAESSASSGTAVSS